MSRKRSGLIAYRRAYGCCVANEQSTPVPPPPPQIITADLLIHFEANDYNSYPGEGDTWINIGTGGTDYNATLLGGDPESESLQLPIFNVDNAGIKSFQFTRNYLGDGNAYNYCNYMRFLRPDAISDDFTYCAWIKTTEVGYGQNHYQLMYIVSTETGDLNNDFGFGIDSDGNLAYGDGSYENADITIRTTTSVNTGDWTFVTVTRSKSTGEVKLYINGILDTTGTCNVGNTLSTAEFVLIGSETDYPGYTFGGNIGAILGNTSVLSEADVLNNFNVQRATYWL
jgi:hypothetical protein